MDALVRRLADSMVLGSLLELLRQEVGAYTFVEHWQQGEFHHDIVLSVPRHPGLPGSVLVIATNCNGGVKEVLCLDEVPDRLGLWSWRCPLNPEFTGPRPTVLSQATTMHWFDPNELLSADARSELRAEFRQRQPGGGWSRRS